MCFNQLLTDNKTIRVRFEIQVRSYYQHLWAIWSESQGENTKIGKEVPADLPAASERIAQWEESNPETIQRQLPGYIAGRHNIVLSWRQQHGLPKFFRFNDNEVERAVKWLNHLENKYPAERKGALLLVGVTSSEETLEVLRLTHPLYTETNKPKDWMPPELGVFVAKREKQDPVPPPPPAT